MQIMEITGNKFKIVVIDKPAVPRLIRTVISFLEVHNP